MADYLFAFLWLFFGYPFWGEAIIIGIISYFCYRKWPKNKKWSEEDHVYTSDGKPKDET